MTVVRFSQPILALIVPGMLLACATAPADQHGDTAPPASESPGSSTEVSQQNPDDALQGLIDSFDHLIQRVERLAAADPDDAEAAAALAKLKEIRADLEGAADLETALEIVQRHQAELEEFRPSLADPPPSGEGAQPATTSGDDGDLM